MANKYYALQKDVFDIDKVTVVGNPTITSDGVVTGFSSSNYLTSQTSIVLDNTISFCFKFRILTNQTTTGAIFNCLNNFQCLIYYSKRGQVCMHLNGNTFVTSAILDDNAIYDVECGYNHLNGEMYVKTTDLNGNTEINNTAAPNTFSHNISAITYGWQNGVGEGNFSGSIYMNTVKIEKNNQLIYTPVKPTYLLERRKPKVWNKGQFTVVGNPSISDDGVASGFSSGNYLTIPSIDMTQPWEGHIDFSTTTLGTASGYLDWGTTEQDNGLVLSSSKWLSFRTIVGQINSDVLKDNTKYSCVFGWSGTQYYLKILEYGTNEWKTRTTNNTTSNSSVNTTVKIGWFDSQFPCLNSLNLKTIKFYQNNTLVFDGGAETYVYDPSKFTVVGTPTITSDGVYTCGNDKANYVKVPFDNTLDSFSLDIEINILDRSQSGYYLGHSNDINYGFMDAYFNGVGITDFRIRVLDETGTAQSLVMGASNYLIGIEKINVTFTGTQYRLTRTRPDGVVYTKTVDSTFKPATNFFSLGYSNKSDVALTTIDLKKITNITDGKEVFTGAKENYYVLRR